MNDCLTKRYILPESTRGSNHHLSHPLSVDPTPPEIISTPRFVSPRDGHEITSQWDRSLLRLAWEFRDPDSAVVSHSVIIRSKETGRQLIDTVYLTSDTEVSGVSDH